MDYEKAYKEALNWMRSIYSTMQGADREDAEHYFPELKESEDERIRKDCIKYLNCEYQACSINKDKMKIEKCVSWLEKQGEQNHTWSEEDEKIVEYILQNCIIYAEINGFVKSLNNNDLQRKAKTWLKSLKDRVQPKQEWSKEDEHCIELLLPIIDSSSLIPKNRKKCKDFLKSLKPKTHWKPSEEQLNALKQCIGGYYSEEADKKLESLYDDLKKL